MHFCNQLKNVLIEENKLMKYVLSYLKENVKVATPIFLLGDYYNDINNLVSWIIIFYLLFTVFVQ